MSWKIVLGASLAGAVVGALLLGALGFLFGAAVPDESAGEAAMLLGGIGLGAGFVGGWTLVFVPAFVLRLLSRKEPAA